MNKEHKYVDLTHKLSPDIPSWDGSCCFNLSINTDYKDCIPPDLFRTQSINCTTSIGTHMDAPAHVIPGGRTIDQLTLGELISECIMIDVSKEADEEYLIMPYVVEDFEKEHGTIKPGSFVIFYTGWSNNWSNSDKYKNNFKWPSIDPTTAELLINRNISGIGTDTFSVDTGKSGFPVHRIILGADKYLVENIANVSELPPTGSKVFVLPMNIKDGTEASIRIIALI
ncbi:MAG: cyclase family protein [bacterium]